MKAIVPNVNIRGCEFHKNKGGESYLLVKFEDSKGILYELVDRNVKRKEFYIRGKEIDLIIDIKQSKQFTKIRIVDVNTWDGNNDCIII